MSSASSGSKAATGRGPSKPSKATAVPSPTGSPEKRRLLDVELGELPRWADLGQRLDCRKAIKEAGKLKLPATMQVMDHKGEVTTVNVSSGEIIACLGLPAPPGGWYGPFGFFRLVSYLFGAVTVLGGLFVLLSMWEQDVFGIFAAILLCAGAVVSGIAAYAHEGLADQVTMMANQNDQFVKKNEKLAAQVKELSGVADQLQKLEKDFGGSADQLQLTLDALHRQTSLQQLMAMLSAFTDADQDGVKDQRLTASEVTDFFDSSDAILKGACPTFDFKSLKTLAMTVGIGLYAMRFMVNALIAAGDDFPHKSTAELSLIMFCFDPEHQLESCLASLTLVLGADREAELRRRLLEKKKFARQEEHGRIPCKELHEISHMVMTFDSQADAKSTASRSMPGTPKTPKTS